MSMARSLLLILTTLTCTWDGPRSRMHYTQPHSLHETVTCVSGEFGI